MSLLEGWESRLAACTPPGGCRVTTQKQWAVIVCLGQRLGRYKVHTLPVSFQLSADSGALVGGPMVWGRGPTSHRSSCSPSFPNLPLSTHAPRGCLCSSAPSISPCHVPRALTYCFTDTNPISSDMLTCDWIPSKD